MKRIDVKPGDRYGRLTIISESNSRRGLRYFLCKCECGNIIDARFVMLRSGQTKSCGCLRNENNRISGYKHGAKYTRIYRCWADMKRRCLTPGNSSFKWYGGRGITICDDWMSDFRAFYDWAIANGYSNNLTLDRIDVNGMYEPSNCRWITIQEQQRNRRK
jgi:hypothetical protein